MGKKRIIRISKSAAVYVPVALLLVVMLILLGTSVFLKIMDIEVTGSTKYTAQEIIEKSGIKTGDNMLRLDTEAAAVRIRSALPYVQDVSIETNLPDRVRINITESKALATVSSSSGVMLINSKARILEHRDKAPAGLIEIRGFTAAHSAAGNTLRSDPVDDTKLRHLIEILSAVEECKIGGSILYLDISNFGRISIGYEERYTVILGGSSDVLYKLSNLPDAVSKIEADPNYDSASRYRIDITDPSKGWICTAEW